MAKITEYDFRTLQENYYEVVFNYEEKEFDSVTQCDGAMDIVVSHYKKEDNGEWSVTERDMKPEEKEELKKIFENETGCLAA